MKNHEALSTDFPLFPEVNVTTYLTQGPGHGRG